MSTHQTETPAASTAGHPVAPTGARAARRAAAHPRARRVAPALLAPALALTGALAATPAAAAEGDDAIFLADDQTTTVAETQFNLGDYAAYLAGDMNGDGIDEIVVTDDGRTFRVTRVADLQVIDTVTMPASDNGAFVGDFDGNGTDELAVRTGNTFTLQDGSSVSYGRDTDIPYIGDFDGDGTDTIAVRRGNVFHFKNTIAPGDSELDVPYGRDTDDVYMGDWDGDGDDTFMVRRDNVNHFKDDLEPGDADLSVAFGRAEDSLLIGDWTGSGAKTLGVVRPNTAVTTQISPAVLEAAAQAEATNPQDPSQVPADETAPPPAPEDVLATTDGPAASSEQVTETVVEQPTGAQSEPAPTETTSTEITSAPAPAYQASLRYQFIDPGAGSEGNEYLGGSMLSAHRDQPTFVDATQTQGATEIQLQSSTDGGRTWGVVDSAPIDPAYGYGHAFLTIPATNAMQTVQYRFAIPPTAVNAGAVGEPLTITHYLAADLPVTDRAAMVSDVIAPYCGDIPVHFVPDDLIKVGDISSAVGLASWSSVTISDGFTAEEISTLKLNFSDLVFGPDTPNYYNGVSQDGYSSFVALHECGHAVAREVLGTSYEDTLAQTYGTTTGADLDEAIANALAQHWLENANGAITSPHMPTDDPRTYLEFLEWYQQTYGTEPFAETEFLHYAGDDALVEQLSTAALTGDLW